MYEAKKMKKPTETAKNKTYLKNKLWCATLECVTKYKQ